MDFEDNDNQAAFLNSKEELEKNHWGQFAVFVHGELVVVDSNRNNALARAYKKGFNPQQSILVKQIGSRSKFKLCQPRRITR